MNAGKEADFPGLLKSNRGIVEKALAYHLEDVKIRKASEDSKPEKERKDEIPYQTTMAGLMFTLAIFRNVFPAPQFRSSIPGSSLFISTFSLFLLNFYLIFISFALSVRVKNASRFFTLARIPISPKSKAFARMKCTLRVEEPLPTFSCIYIAIDLDSFRLNERKFDNDPPTFVRHIKPDCLRPIFVLGPDSHPALILENLKKLATHEPRRFDDETEMRLAFLTVPGGRYPKKEVVAINSAIWAGEFPCVALTHQMAVSACTVPMGKDRHPLPILNRSQGNNLYL